MELENRKIGPTQNIGLADRIVRFFGGGAMLAGGVFDVAFEGHISPLSGVVILLAVYPLMTTVMGWDPIYQLFGAKSCTLEEGRNACGTFPYEMDSALGREPKAHVPHNHSLGGSHHESKLRKVG